MSGKYRSRAEFLKVQERFVENCIAKGHPDKTTFEILRQIESFAGYAFAKGHSASYAVESYQSLYLKTYYPLEYMVAVLNNGGGFYSAELYIHEARRHGAMIEAPCVNQSHYANSLSCKSIYLGFCMLRGLEMNVALRIIEEREKQGPFLSLSEFLERVPIGVEQLDVLIRINAFRFTGMDKRNLLWKANAILNANPYRGNQRALPGFIQVNHKIPAFEVSNLENAFDEVELLGYPLCSPFELLENELPENLLSAKDIAKYRNQIITMYGYLITIKTTTTSNKQRMQFGTYLDIIGEWIDTVQFPPVVKKYPHRGRGVYKIVGKVMEEFSFYTLEVISVERLAYREDARFKIEY